MTIEGDLSEENSGSTSLSGDRPQAYPQTYFMTYLHITWACLDDRDVRRLRKKHPTLVTAIEGVLKYDRR